MPSSTVNAPRTDPLRNFKFQVSITPPAGQGALWRPTDFARAGFTSVSGLAATTEVIPYREGGMNTTSRKLPGQSDFPSIQLTRGLFDAGGMGHHAWYWFKQIFFYQQGEGFGQMDNNFRTDFIIRLLAHPVTRGPQAGNYLDNTAEGGIKAMWKVYNAWPQAVSFSDLDAGGNAVAVQQLVLAHEGIETKFAANGGMGIADEQF